ncbi:hypothetical protein MesoLjLc_33440 [Mesorhizobium sp. L-8-10]|uniref:hypothetical protein n=1 Tax=Mesorhizobium sp. L-8-10 TaxID=2744523 RepID=UPI001928A301|nr:hypothetical protein [Mesorhizobium sp. L-8-10]BCH31414.1 hypothetical protein MesoLjLc_33440 [Mesorhizobium sp. L-8-10]
MSEAGEKATVADKGRRLSDAIREVKNAAADCEDVVVEMREAQRTRLELLAAELHPVFADVPADVETFDFVISSGLQPRLWIDAVSHVAMGRDRRTYRFVRDTRLGRVVLAESTDMKPVADKVTHYIAERLVERQRMMEGGVEPVLVAASDETGVAPEAAPGSSKRVGFGSGLLAVLAGILAGLVVAALLFRDRLAAFWPDF